MVSQQTWYGGSLDHTSGDLTLGLKSPRVIRVTASNPVTLPDLTNAILTPIQYGGFRFMIIMEHASTLTIEDADSNVIATLSENEVGHVSLYQSAAYGADMWNVTKRTVGTPRSVGHTARDPLVATTPVATFDPADLFCFVGNDCEQAAAEPLDGEGGRALVVVPMFQNSCGAANENREAVRAADVIMPSKMALRLTPECFSVDSNHPLTQSLPEAFFEALYQDGQPHILEHSLADKLTSATSRNPYHLRYDGATPTFNATTCVKHFWKSTKQVEVGANTYDLDIVLQAEHTVLDEPALTGNSDPLTSEVNTVTADASPAKSGTFTLTVNGDETDPIPYNADADDILRELLELPYVVTGSVAVAQTAGNNLGEPNAQVTITWQGPLAGVDMSISIDNSNITSGNPHVLATLVEGGLGAGGTHDDDAGIWGTLFCLYIFYNQISPSFNDGDTHTPAGGSSPVQFFRHDPFVWGNAPGVAGGNDDDKFAHPQLMAAAFFVTTMHSPCQFEWVPLLHRALIPPQDAVGWNASWIYRRPNCLPWVTDPDSDLSDICTNCGSLGEGILRNTHFSHDNGTDPLAAMTLGGDFPLSRPNSHLCWENGAGIGRTFLSPGSPGWDEEIGELTTTNCGTLNLCIDWDKSWNEFDYNTCDGHPAEPTNGVGGTHNCFKNAITGDDTQCCIDLLGTASAHWKQKCTKDTTVYGNRTSSICEILDFGCEEVGDIDTNVAMAVYDYNFGTPGSPAGSRELEYRHYAIDPEATLYNYTYDPGDVGDITTLFGSFTLGATITCTPTGTGMTAALQYNPTRGGVDGEWRDGTLSCKFKNCTNIGHGIGFRMFDDAFNNPEGIGAYIEPTGVDTGNAVISRWDNGIETVLVSQAIVLDNDVVDVVLVVHGTDITFSWEVMGGEDGEITARYCTLEVAGPTLFTIDDGDTAEFEDWIILDQSYQYRSHEAALQNDGIYITGEEVLMAGFGQCDEMSAGCCGTCCNPECCNCTAWFHILWSDFSSSHTGGDLLGLPSPSDPTFCGGPFHRQDCYGDWCSPAIYYCGDCPFPWPCIDFCLPTPRCFEDDPDKYAFHYAAEDEPNICKGLTQWCWTNLVCA